MNYTLFLPKNRLDHLKQPLQIAKVNKYEQMPGLVRTRTHRLTNSGSEFTFRFF